VRAVRHPKGHVSDVDPMPSGWRIAPTDTDTAGPGTVCHAQAASSDVIAETHLM
jgi:hypothetical protein